MKTLAALTLTAALVSGSAIAAEPFTPKKTAFVAKPAVKQVASHVPAKKAVAYDKTEKYEKKASDYGADAGNEYENPFLPFVSVKYGDWKQSPQGYYFCYCYFKPYKYATDYQKYVCVSYPSHPHWVYYFNPINKRYWGRFDAQVRGFQTLPAEEQRPKVGEINDESFAKAGPISIPDSAIGENLSAPPAVPTGNAAPAGNVAARGNGAPQGNGFAQGNGAPRGNVAPNGAAPGGNFAPRNAAANGAPRNNGVPGGNLPPAGNGIAPRGNVPPAGLAAR